MRDWIAGELRRLVHDGAYRERVRREGAAIVWPMPVADVKLAIERPADSVAALSVARRRYADLLVGSFDDEPPDGVEMVVLANLCAVLAAVVGRDAEARRWIRIAEADASAGELDGAGTIGAWWRTVEIVATALRSGGAGSRRRRCDR